MRRGRVRVRWPWHSRLSGTVTMAYRARGIRPCGGLDMIYVLRLLHILSGAFWYGAVVFSVRFLAPSLRDAGPAAGPVLAQLNRRNPSAAMMGAALVNVASGIWLIFLVSGGAPAAWMRSGMGRTIGLGAGLAILALVVGMSMSAPSMHRLGRLGAAAAQRGGPPTADEAAEIARLQKRLALATTFVAILLTLAVSAMALARYVP